MENTKDNLKLEKNLIIFLIILSLVLVFFSIFFIHDIIDLGTLNTSQTVPIPQPQNPDNNNQNNNQNGTNSNQNNNQQPIVIDENARIRLLENSTDWKDLIELDIFNTNYSCVKEGKIAPGVQGTYVYTVENYGEKRMVYDMKFTDENPYKINLIYKLKRNGQYVAGNEENWVRTTDMDLSDLKIDAKTSDIFTIEWRWEDAENDTEIGETEGAYYKLFISSYAEVDSNQN